MRRAIAIVTVAVLMWLGAAQAAPPIEDEPNEISWEHFGACLHCFEDFVAWSARRALPGLSPPQAQPPEVFQWIWVEGESFPSSRGWQREAGGTDRFARTPTSGGHVLATSAGGGADSRRLLRIPKAGRYRLWVRYWHSRGRHSSLEVRVLPKKMVEFQFFFQTTTEGEFLSHRFDHPRFGKLDLGLADLPDGFVWECSPTVELPAGEVCLELGSSKHLGPPGPTAVDCVVLTEDPLARPSLSHRPDEPTPGWAAAFTRHPADRTRKLWSYWRSRPGRAPVSGVGSTTARNWRAWRRDLLGRLAAGRTENLHHRRLAASVYFNEQWNLIGTPAQVAGRIRDLRTRTAKGPRASARAGKPPALILWRQKNCWLGFRQDSRPGRAAEVSPKEIRLSPARGEVSPVLLHLANPGDKPIRLEPSVQGGGLVRWRVAAYQLSKKHGWQPMPLLVRRSVTVPPRHTASLWVDVDARALVRGRHTAVLTLGAQRVRIIADVQDIGLDKAPIPLVGGWARPFAFPESWKAFADHGVNVIYNRVVSKAEMRRYGIRMCNVHLGPAQDVSKDGWPGGVEYVRRIVAAVRSMGLDYDDWSWTIKDEPSDRSYPRVVEAGKIIRKADPNLRMWLNPGGMSSCGTATIRRMAPYIDVFCPYVDHFVGGEHERTIRRIGRIKLLYTTPCYNEKAPDAPLQLLQPGELSLRYGRDGWNFYSLLAIFRGRGSPWDEIGAYHGDQAISVYPGAGKRSISTRNFEAVREAVQRWRRGKLAEAGKGGDGMSKGSGDP